LQANGDVVEVVECLDQCTRCEHQSFALVSGVFVYASSPEELVTKLCTMQR